MPTRYTSPPKTELSKATNCRFSRRPFRPSPTILNSNDMKICRSPYSFILSLGILVTACIEPYPAPVIDGDIDYLVIDGSVDGLDGTASVTLSHAVPLASTEPPPPELNADV